MARAHCPLDRPWLMANDLLSSVGSGVSARSHGYCGKSIQEVARDIWQDLAKPVDSVAEQSSGTLACGDGTCCLPVPDCGREIDGDMLASTRGRGNMQAVVVQSIEAMGREGAAYGSV